MKTFLLPLTFMRSLFSSSRLVVRAVCALFSVVWLWCGVSVGGYAQTQADTVWVKVPNAPPFVKCSVSLNGRLIVGTINKGIFFSDDNGRTWTISRAPALDVWGLALCRGSIWGVARRIDSDRTIFRSNDNGVTWQSISVSLVNQFDKSCWSIIASGDTIVIGGTGSIVRSTDAGITWTTIWQNGSRVVCGEVRSLAMEENSVLAGINCRGLIRLKDEGSFWSESSITLSNTFNGTIYSTYNIHIQADTIIAPGYDTDNLWSSNRGRTWQLLSILSPKKSFWGAALWQKGGYWLGTDNGVLRGTMRESIWLDFSRGFDDDKSIVSLFAHQGNVFASTLTGLWRLDSIVQRPPAQISATPQLSATPQQILLDTIVHFDPSPQRTYTVTGANLSAPVIITAPEGILLFSATTGTWTRTLTLPTSATGSVMQTVAVRLDSSQIRSIVNQEITNVSAGVQAFVRVSGAVVPLFLPDGAETTLELRLAQPLRSPFLIRDTARVQVWLKDSRLLTPRLIGRFAKKLHITLRLDTNNFNIVGVTAPASTRASFDTIASPRRLPRTSPFTTLLIDRIDTTMRELLLAELLLQAAVGATTTNTLRAAQPTTWLGNTPANTARITWGVDSLRLEIRPLFAPRRQTAFVAVAAPNPSNGEIELHYTLSPATQETVPLTLLISDMAGRVLQSVELGERKVGEAQRETVHLRGLAAGTYRIVLVSPLETLFGRVDIVR